MLEAAILLRRTQELLLAAEERLIAARAAHTAKPDDTTEKQSLAAAQLARATAAEEHLTADRALELASRTVYGGKQAVGWRGFFREFPFFHMFRGFCRKFSIVHMFRAFWPDLPVVLMVLLAGAIGGWIASQTGIGQDGKPFQYLDWAKANTCIATMIVGAAAAGVTVFFVAKTDTSKVWHCFFFALICGVAGLSIIEAATKSVDKTDPSRGADQAAQTLETVKQDVKSSPPTTSTQVAALTSDLAGAGATAVKSANQATQADDLVVAAKANKTALAVVTNLEKIGTSAVNDSAVFPNAPIEALRKLSAQATLADNTIVAEAATEAVKKLEQSQTEQK